MSDSAEEKGFFERMGEILNSGLPGTTPAPSSATEEEDDDSLLARIRDVLEQPLPGTQAPDATLPPAVEAPPAAPGAQAPGSWRGQPQPQTPAPPIAPAPAGQAPTADWQQQDQARFDQHQERERAGFQARQQQELAAFQRYQAEQSRQFAAGQGRELALFHRHQQARLQGWQGPPPGAPGFAPPMGAWPPGPPGPRPPVWRGYPGRRLRGRRR